MIPNVGQGAPYVSNHLGCLHECGLVTREREGRHVQYGLSDPRVGELLSVAEELLADVARGVYECARYAVTEGGRDAK